MSYKSKHPSNMQQYLIMLEMARDKKSSLYNSDGSQRKGASHRDSFWRGFNFGDSRPDLIPARNTLAYPCFKAGMDYAAEVQNAS